MIWYLMTLTSYVYRYVTRMLAPGAQKRVRGESDTDQRDAGFSRHTNNPPRRRNRLGRTMSLSGGVDGAGQSIAVLTSGGDSQGMNAAIRATVRMGLYAGAKMYAVQWGYQGLVDGDIRLISWEDVSCILHKGGTVIGSARCMEFKERAGRKKAALNLIKREITNLVVIGGDGSLTGADLFRKEWSSLLHELYDEGLIKKTDLMAHSYLNVVGMVGSIDNDFCGTDMTIGADSALHRIIENVDAISTTAESHQRAFILEVMGRNCGYLALITGISCGADWIFIPENPAEDGWEEELCDNLKKIRAKGRLLTILILSEGAQDVHGNPITTSQVKDLLTNQLNLDTRATVLGHVQRGGRPSAFDRLLASRLGAEAALSIIEADSFTEPMVMCLKGAQVVSRPLHQCVAECNAIKEAYKQKDFERVVELRGHSFQTSLVMYQTLKHISEPKNAPAKKGFTFGVMTIGAPAGGMNAAVRAYVRTAVYQGHTVLGISDGFDGLLQNKVSPMSWSEVDRWAETGGSNLGVSRTLASSSIGDVNNRFIEHGINALLIVGGFEAFRSLVELTEQRAQYKGFRIPMVLIPATMSNNVPGTWFSLGADTTLNVIVECCDKLRQSAGSTTQRVFVVETMGGKCGYLATMAAIAAGADSAYTFEERLTLNELKKNIEHLKQKFSHSSYRRGLVLRSEDCSDNYTTDFIAALYAEEGRDHFKVRTNVLGHMQQGGSPSTFDRLCGTRHGVKAFNYLLQQIEVNETELGIEATSNESSCVLGHIKNSSQFTPVFQLKPKTDFENRLPRDYWWKNIRPLLKVLAQYEVMFSRELDDQWTTINEEEDFLEEEEEGEVVLVDVS